jgi:hypothetical protein
VIFERVSAFDLGFFGGTLFYLGRALDLMDVLGLMGAFFIFDLELDCFLVVFLAISRVERMGKDNKRDMILLSGQVSEIYC